MTIIHENFQFFETFWIIHCQNQSLDNEEERKRSFLDILFNYQ